MVPDTRMGLLPTLDDSQIEKLLHTLNKANINVYFLKNHWDVLKSPIIGTR